MDIKMRCWQIDQLSCRQGKQRGANWKKNHQTQTKKPVHQPFMRANSKVFGMLIDALSICFLCVYQITANICLLVTNSRSMLKNRLCWFWSQNWISLIFWLQKLTNGSQRSNSNYHSNSSKWDWRKGLGEVVHADSKECWFWMLTPELSAPWFWENLLCVR